MEFLDTKIQDCYLINVDNISDNRGSFAKLYHGSSFLSRGVEVNIQEQYITVSNRNVLRGMHFQLPPYNHSKLVTCLNGSVLDVILDLRVDSESYLKYDSFELSGKDKQSIIMPSGVAHGFISLENSSSMLYSTTCEYDSDHDSGISWDSFGFEWPCDKPILSERDKNHTILNNFRSPFKV